VHWVVGMLGNARYFRRRPWWMAKYGVSNNFCATVGFPLGAGCGGHTTLGKWFELGKAQRRGPAMSTNCVCVTSIEFGLLLVATFHIRPEHLPVAATTRYVTAVWQVVADLRWSVSGRQRIAFAVEYSNVQPLRFDLHPPKYNMFVRSAKHLARRAPRNLVLHP